MPGVPHAGQEKGCGPHEKGCGRTEGNRIGAEGKMITGLYTAGASLKALQSAQEITARNIAHMETIGYKRRTARMVSFGQHLDEVERETPLESTLDLSQGDLQYTGGSLDIALEGPCFLAIRTPTGLLYERIAFLVEKDLSLYAVHLPLDFHKECGNNHVMASKLGLRDVREIKAPDGVIIVEGELRETIGRREAFDHIEKTLDLDCLFWPFGPDKVKKIGICSGGAASYVPRVLEAGHDLYLTGEPSHSYYHSAMDGGLNVAFGGHYRTETFGVKAMQQHLEEKFGLKTFFIDVPTGH